MKKKITFFIPNIDDGGIEKNLIFLSNQFSKNNYNVEVIYSRISKNIKKKLIKKILLVKIKKFFSLKMFNERINNSINCFLYSIIKMKFQKNTIIFSMQDHVFSILLSKIKKIPCIIRIANHPKASLKFFNNYIVYKIKLFIKIFFYQFANLIICNSKESSHFFKKNFYIKKKIITIYNPIISLKNKVNYKRKKNEILTISRLENQKNLTGLIKAIHITSKKIQNIKLTIVGKGSEKQKLKKLVNDLKLNKFIEFVNFKNPHSYFKKKGIFILNSFFEGLPNVLIEALQYKIPIISTNCQSGPNEILKKGKYGFLTKVNDEYDVAKKITYVISNYQTAKNKANLGYKSLFRFSLDSQFQKYKKSLKFINL